MKKTISLLIALVIMLNMLTLPAFAVNTDKLAVEDLVDLGCTVFPEYAEKIVASCDKDAIQTNSRQALRIVMQETRDTSENTQLTYIELSNGEVLLANNHYTVNPSLIYQDSEGAGIVVYTYSFTITRLASAGSFALNNFRYRMYPNAYDTIISSGTVVTNPGCRVTSNSFTPNETAAGPARVAFGLMFVLGQSGTDAFQCDFVIKVQNNNLTYYVVDYEA